MLIAFAPAMGARMADDDRFTVIVENDITEWHDNEGVTYHYPRRYRPLLTPGTRLIHYKGKLRDRAFAADRMSEHPHYFATSIAGKSTIDATSAKGDMHLEIVGFQRFNAAVHHKDQAGGYREEIPAARAANFWRDGVRKSSAETFHAIVGAAGIVLTSSTVPEPDGELTSVMIEGGKKLFYSTRYERRPELREKAKQIHGTRCFACDDDLGAIYGAIGKGFIHIHHKRPLYLTGETPVDPAVDLVPLCPTCHAIVHLGGELRTVNQVRSLLGKQPIPLGD